MAAKLITSGQTDAHGNIQLSGSGALGDALADHLKSSLKPLGGKAPRVRADTLGYAQRCFPDASPVDQAEARHAGRAAAHLAKQGDHDGSIAITRKSDSPYEAEFKRIELKEVAGKTQHLRKDFLLDNNDVADTFSEWLRPLLGEMPQLARLPQ
jgi:6-phosphofructokinase 1